MLFIPGIVVAVLTFPGVIVHEWAHAFMCRALRVPVYEVCYFRFGNPAGYVVHAPPVTLRQSWWISVGPLFINSGLALLLGALAGLLSHTGLFLAPLIGWLSVSIGAHAIPSSQDLGNLMDRYRFSPPNSLLTRLALRVTIFALAVFGGLRALWADVIYAFWLFSFGQMAAQAPLGVLLLCGACLAIPLVWAREKSAVWQATDQQITLFDRLEELWDQAATWTSGEVHSSRWWTNESPFREVALLVVKRRLKLLDETISNSSAHAVRDLLVECISLGHCLASRHRDWEHYFPRWVLTVPEEFTCGLKKQLRFLPEDPAPSKDKDEAILQDISKAVEAQLLDAGLDQSVISSIVEQCIACLRLGGQIASLEDSVIRQGPTGASAIDLTAGFRAWVEKRFSRQKDHPEAR